MVQAIILAAGRSVRMGKENKLLMTIGQESIIRTTVSNIQSSKVDDIIVVAGFDFASIMQELHDLQANIVYNASHKQGMTSSIMAGISQMRLDADAIMICLADMPLIQPEDYNTLIDYHNDLLKTHEKPIIRPAYSDNYGHPVLFHSSYTDQLMKARSNNGCREVIKDNLAHFHAFDAKDIKYFFDIDTPHDYKRLLRYLNL